MSRRTITLTLSDDEYQLLQAEHQALRDSLARWVRDSVPTIETSVEDTATVVLLEQLRELASRRQAQP